MKQKYITTAAYYIAFILLGLTIAAEGPTLLKLAEHTASALDQISSIFLFGSLGYLLGSYIGGRLYDRVPGHRLMSGVLLCLGITVALVPLASSRAALFTIALCSMWPTVINTMAGVKAIPQEYWNVAKVLRLTGFQTFSKVLLPATLPHMFTGYRLSLGIAWLVIVASEMLTGTPGIGGFLWQEYNSLIYAHILLAILTIGIVGFTLDRLMGMAESKLRAI